MDACKTVDPGSIAAATENEWISRATACINNNGCQFVQHFGKKVILCFQIFVNFNFSQINKNECTFRVVNFITLNAFSFRERENKKINPYFLIGVITTYKGISNTQIS